MKAIRAERGITASTLLLIIVVVGTGTAVAIAVLRRPTGRRVPVVGDSITVFAGHDIKRALSPTYHAEIHAVFGQRIDQMLPTLRHDVAQQPFAVVVNLGTNDVLQARQRSDWHANTDAMIAAAAPARCVVFTTISTLVNAPTAIPALATQINDVIEHAVATHRNFHVIDWNRAVNAPGGTSLLIADKVHPSPIGQLRLAAMIKHALDTDCPR
jgi:hypothetical protein